MIWHARFVAPERELDAAPVLFTTLRLEPGHGEVARARMFVSALGVCEPSIDGEAVSDELLTPGWTSYQWRLRVREHDVTDGIRDGSELSLKLGNGWYRGRLTWTGAARLYGGEQAGFLELRIRYADGHEQTVGTGPAWRARGSDTLSDDLYDGQAIDARRRGQECHGVEVREVPFDLGRLVEFRTPPIRRLLELEPVRCWRSPAGRLLVDFGQNLVGWVRVRIRGEAGARLTLRHAEVLERGELGVRPLRSARATDVYVLSGGEDVFEPTFTLHGFRYVEVSGWRDEPDTIVDALRAVAVGSDIAPTGTFETSDELLNRLHQNVVWSMRGNFVALPTDCPQRDERLGWTGDIAVFAPTAAFIGDAGEFLGDWLRDLDLEQSHAAGLVPLVVPDVLRLVRLPPEFPAPETVAIWSDAAVWVPWALWQAYADREALAEQLPAMVAHGRRVRSLLSPTGLWDQGHQLGDWLDPDAPPDRPAQAKADPAVVATACAFRTARILADATDTLEHDQLHDEFAAMAAGLREAFQRHFVGERAQVRSDCVTVYALAICFGLLDPGQIDAAGARLAELVRDAGHRIATGFAGTPFVMDALTRAGYIEDAYALLMQTGVPSWLYPVTMGATTVWERWDSMLADGSINPGEMTSFNHYALGAVADWLHRVVGGIAPLEPGYRRFLVAPRPGGGLSWAQAALRTRHGRIAVAWRLERSSLRVEVDVPPGTEAVLALEGLPERRLGPGHHHHTALSPRRRPAPAVRSAGR